LELSVDKLKTAIAAIIHPQPVHRLAVLGAQLLVA
jgi:hypothetical protein